MRHYNPLQNDSLHQNKKDRYLHFVSFSKDGTDGNHHYVSFNELHNYHTSDFESQKGAKESVFNNESISESENEENFGTEEWKDVKIKYEKEDNTESRWEETE